MSNLIDIISSDFVFIVYITTAIMSTFKLMYKLYAHAGRCHITGATRLLCPAHNYAQRQYHLLAVTALPNNKYTCLQRACFSDKLETKNVNIKIYGMEPYTDI